MPSDNDETNTGNHYQPLSTNDDKKPSCGWTVPAGLKSFLADISSHFDVAYGKFESIAKCNCFFAFLSIMSIGQLAVFVMGATKLGKCTASYELPKWLMMQAACTIVWHFVANFIRNRHQFANVNARCMCNCICTLAISAFAIFHFVIMFMGVSLTYANYDNQAWPWAAITAFASPTARYDYSYYGYRYGPPTCDSLAYWTAFGIANFFLGTLVVFFLIFAVRSMCSRSKGQKQRVGEII